MRLALLSMTALAILGCDEDDIFTMLPPPVVQIDELKQKPAALVDILWVVDNSGSMVEEQQALADNFNRFITGLTTCQGTGMADDICNFETKKCSRSNADCNPPDYHIGVIATDTTAPADSGKLRKVGLCVPATGATPSNGKFRYCQGSNQECAPSAMDPASDPANAVCDMNQSILYVAPTTPGAVNAFARLVRVGVTGSGLEQGIRAAAQALGRDTDRATGQFIAAPAENLGFLRPEASLFVIFVSDEEDSTFGETTYFYRAFESLKGAGNESVVSVSSIVGDPDVDGDGTELGGCPANVPPDMRIAAPGNRYVSLSMYSRGLSAEFRVCDEKRLLCAAGSKCSAPVAGLPGVCVPETCTADAECGTFKCLDGAGCIKCEANACTLPSTRFLELLEQTGVFGSICAPDYGKVLGSLGFEAAGLQRKFVLTKNPNCVEKVKCCADGSEDASCMEETPICVRVNGAPIPNERTAGWVYETGSNAVFFDGDFVPPTDATVTIAYKVLRAGQPTACASALQ